MKSSSLPVSLQYYVLFCDVHYAVSDTDDLILLFLLRDLYLMHLLWHLAHGAVRPILVASQSCKHGVEPLVSGALRCVEIVI